jgi:hypothetical protein
MGLAQLQRGARCQGLRAGRRTGVGGIEDYHGRIAATAVLVALSGALVMRWVEEGASYGAVRGGFMGEVPRGKYVSEEERE